VPLSFRTAWSAASADSAFGCGPIRLLECAPLDDPHGAVGPRWRHHTEEGADPVIPSLQKRRARFVGLRTPAIIAAVLLACALVSSSCATARFPSTTSTVNGVVTPTVTVAPQLPTVHEVTHLEVVGGGSSVTASCAPGEVALGGGWEAPPDARVYAATLNGANWSVAVAGSSSAPWVVIATVHCLTGAPGATVTQRVSSVTAQPYSTVAEEAACQSPGETQVGFGFAFADPTLNLELTSDIPTPDSVMTRAWMFKVTSRDSQVNTITLAVHCLANVAVSANYPVGQRISQTAIATCPIGSVVAGGGASYTTFSRAKDNAHILRALPNGWRVRVDGDVLSEIQATAVCLRFT
jgi:hypothetical protein